VSPDLAIPVLVTIISAATPLLLAAIGELVVEKSGVLNLGVEGMMLAGAVTAFAATVATGNSALGVLAGAAAGVALAFLFGVLTLTLVSNQVAGPLLFGHDALVYLSVLLTVGVALFLKRTRPGMILRACGESDESAHSIGYDVVRIRYLAVLFGGLTSGLAGAYLSLVYTPMWVEEMSAGRGWIALALVVFASWRPWRLLLGAYLFGGVSILQLYVQGAGGIGVPSEVLSMLPYLATVVVLTAIAAGPWRGRLDAPACLGRPFRPAT
jgi:simple sugar transport system permease protein